MKAPHDIASAFGGGYEFAFSERRASGMERGEQE
jgi:hypothetical protein